MNKIVIPGIDQKKLIDNLYLSDKLEDLGASNLVNTSIMFIFGFFTFIFLWMYFVNIQEVSRAPGVIVPADNLYQVQHLEGGIIYKVPIKDGEIVQKGSILFELSPEPVVSELHRLYNTETTVLFTIARLKSFLANKQLTREDLEKITNYRSNDHKSLDFLIDNTLLLFHHQMQQRQQEQDSIEQLIHNKELHIINLDKQIDNLSERTDLLSTKTEIYKNLNKEQYASKVNVINSQDKEQEIFGDYLSAVREKNTVEAAIIELHNQKRFNDMKSNKQALEELNQQVSELLNIRKQIEKVQDRVTRLHVVSPIYGIVKGVDLKPGQVISPGEIVFEIVPITKKLIVEAKISPDDIGHISLGDLAKIKVSSFDYSIYGQLNGKIKHISANTFSDPNGDDKYYKAVLSLDKNYLGEDPSSNLIIPGMKVTADIQTDRRSLLTYFLKPINKTINEAFRER